MASPVSSCISRPRSERAVIIRESFVRLFDGDHCAAALLAYLEYLTNGELARLRNADESGDPWIKASMHRLVEGLLAHYGERSIEAAISLMKKGGILKDDQERRGKVKEYCLDVSALNKMLDSGSVIRKNAGEKSPSPAATSAATSAKMHHVDAAYSNKEKEVEEEVNPVAPFLEEVLESTPTSKSTATAKSIISDDEPEAAPVKIDLESSVEDFVKFAYRRERGLKLKLTGRDGNFLAERLKAKEASVGPVEFRTNLLAFLAEDTAWLREKGWPVNVFLAKVESGGPVRAARSLPQASPAPSRRHASASGPAAIVPSDSGVPWHIRWNALVPSRPMGEINPKFGFPVKELAEAMEHPEFRDNIAAIFGACEKIIKAKGAAEVSWLTLDSIVRPTDDGKPIKWHKLYTGGYDFMFTANKSLGRSAAVTAELDDLIAQHTGKKSEIGQRANGE